eukprot:5791850-Pyramimonas_sp.AAC.1
MPNPLDFPPWLSQQRYGQSLAPRTLVPMGYPAQEGEPPSAGTWHAGDARHLWPRLPNHKQHEQWDIIIVFTGRVLTRFSFRVCSDGALVSREVPKFTDIDKAVSL